MISDEIRKKFFFKTEDSGRFVVKSLNTGKTYYVETFDEGEITKWGDLNPSTNKVEGDYGSKHKGAIKRSESLITEENGFTNIRELQPCESPLDYINRIDDEYFKQMLHNKD